MCAARSAASVLETRFVSRPLSSETSPVVGSTSSPSACSVTVKGSAYCAASSCKILQNSRSCPSRSMGCGTQVPCSSAAVAASDAWSPSRRRQISCVCNSSSSGISSARSAGFTACCKRSCNTSKAFSMLSNERRNRPRNPPRKASSAVSSFLLSMENAFFPNLFIQSVPVGGAAP